MGDIKARPLHFVDAADKTLLMDSQIVYDASVRTSHEERVQHFRNRYKGRHRASRAI